MSPLYHVMDDLPDDVLRELEGVWKCECGQHNHDEEDECCLCGAARIDSGEQSA